MESLKCLLTGGRAAVESCDDAAAIQGAGKPTIYKGSWVEAWNKTGFSVCGIDQQVGGLHKPRSTLTAPDMHQL